MEKNTPTQSPQDLAFWRELDALRLRAEQLSLILEGVQDHAVSMLDPSGAIVTWNATAERVKGYALEDVRGKHFRMLFAEEERKAGLPERELEIARTTGKYLGEGYRLRKDGSRFFASVSLSAVYDDSGELKAYVKVTHDISARVRAQRGVLILSEASSAMASSFDEAQTLVDFANAVTKEFAQFVAVDLFDDDGVLTRQLVVHDERTKDDLVRQTLPLEHSDKAKVLKLPPIDASLRFTSAMIVPIQTRDKALGQIALGSSFQLFEESDLQIALELARRLSLAIESARLFHEIKQDRQRLDTALDAGKLGAWEWDIGTQRVTWSPVLEDIHGVPRGSFPGTFEAYQADIHPDDKPRVLGKVTETVQSGEPQHNIYRIIRPDGQVRWLETHGRLLYDRQGKPSCLTGVCSDITERKEAQDRLEDSERRFRAVFDGALDPMVITDDNRRFVEVNPAACALLHRSSEALIGTSAADLHESGELATSYWKELSRTSVGRGEARLRRADGALVHIEFSARKNILPGRHLAVWRDVASRKRAEQLLAFVAEASIILARNLDYREAIARVAELAVPLVSDWVCIDLLEPDGTFRPLAVAHADKSKVAEIFEIRKQQPPSTSYDHGAGLVVRTGKTEVLEIAPEMMIDRYPDPVMREKILAVAPRGHMCAPLAPRGKIVGAITFVSAESGRSFSPSDVRLAEDVALRMGLAIDNAMLFESEQVARKNADLANQAKDDFLATVSHELRTPLNAMLGWTRMLRTGELSPEKREQALETIERNAMNQAQLIEDLLDVTRIISGKLRLEASSVELAPLVEHVRESLRPASEKKLLRVDIHVDPELEPIDVDANRIQQVIWNLLSNSVKFTPDGGSIRLTIEGSADMVKIRVVDTGSGIKAEFLPLVFERFKQADGAITRAHRGLGLGLAISAHIVELHGGKIEVQSDGEGKGACFTVTLPRKRIPVQASDQREGVNDLHLQFRPELRNLRVLVVDDEEDGRDLLTAVLERAGAIVMSAENAADAFEIIRAEKPDVLVSDIGMAGTDGYDLIRRIRALKPEEGGTTPAAALTAYARAEDRKKALDAGFMMHLAKPVEPAELMAVIANLTRFRESKG